MEAISFAKSKKHSDEISNIDGYTVVMRFCEESNPAVAKQVKATLFGQFKEPEKVSNICNNG